MIVPRDASVVLTPDGDLVSEGDGPARLWPYTQAWWRPWRSTRPELVDPVNGMVLRAGPAAVLAALAGGGWERPPDGAVHRTWIDGRGRRMVDHIALGDRSERVHVRVWAFGPHTLFAAHHEVMDERGHHVVVSWDAARATVGEALHRAGFAGLAPTGPVTLPALRDVPGDGRVWRWVGDAAG